MQGRIWASLVFARVQNVAHIIQRIPAEGFPMRLPLIAVSLSVLGLSACTWVPMAPEASAVHVVSAGAAPAGCDKRGDINVSVKHSVAFYERNALRVRDELETLARTKLQPSRPTPCSRWATRQTVPSASLRTSAAAARGSQGTPWGRDYSPAWSASNAPLELKFRRKCRVQGERAWPKGARKHGSRYPCRPFGQPRRLPRCSSRTSPSRDWRMSMRRIP